METTDGDFASAVLRSDVWLARRLMSLREMRCRSRATVLC